MIEKKKTHKPLPKSFTLTICQHDLDMLESAVAQLATRRPQVCVPVSDGEDAESARFD